jgi:hypothetical protein
VCCCDKHQGAKNPFAPGQSPANKKNPNLLKSRATPSANDNPTPVQKRAHDIILTPCVQTLANYVVNVGVDTAANQAIACQGGSAFLADLSDIDYADLEYLFAECNLSNGAYFNSFDQLQANPCGYIYAIPSVFGYARYLIDTTACDFPRGAICKITQGTTTTFGSVSPQTTTDISTEVSTSVITSTISTTLVSTSLTTTTLETTFVVPDISTNFTTTSTTVSIRTSPSLTTTRTTTTTPTTLLINTTTTDPTVVTTFTGSTTSTSTSFTSTSTTTTTVTLIGKRK